MAAATTLAKFAGTVLLGAVAATSGAERERLLLAAVGAVVLAAYGLRDLLAPVRLAADAEGVTVVSGYAGHRRIPWCDVERVGVGTHRTLGLRTEVLEIDTGESLHLFGRYDLGAPCEEVERVLVALRGSAEEDHAEAGGEKQQRGGDREHTADARSDERRAGRVDPERRRGEPGT